MKRLLLRPCLITFAALFVVQALQAQQAAFTLPDTVCVNVPVTATNTTLGASNFLWNFCISSLDSTPSAVNLGVSEPTLALPAYIDYAEDNGNYYAFVVNNYPGGLVELSFGNSLTNPPTYTYLGDIGVIPPAAEGIQVINNNGEWYAIIVGGNTTSGAPPCIVKIDLGSSLASLNPVGTNWGNIGGLDYPHQLQLLQIGGIWYGFTVNYDNNTITEFQFGTSFANPPTAINLGDLGGLVIPTGFFIVQQGGSWYMFVTSEGGNTLTRLDFGSSLLNPNPVATNLGNPGGTLNGPRAVSIISLCGRTEGLIVNDQTSNVVLLQFPGGIDSPPTAESLGNIGTMDYPVSISTIFAVGSDLYAFVPNVDNNSITRLVFESCNNINIPNSSLQNPPPFSYSIPGIYNINLMANTGLPTQSSYCQTIVVLPAPTIQLPADTTFCMGTQVKLAVQPYPGATYAWNTGSDSTGSVINASGNYTVSLNDYGCVANAAVTADALPLPVINLPADTLLCDSGELRYITPQPVTYVWNTASITDSTRADTSGSYWLQLNEAGCTAIDTVNVTIVSTDQVHLGNDTTYCGPGTLQVSDTGQVTYQWNTGSDSSSTQVTATGIYSLALNDRGCVSRGSVQIAVVALPDVYLPKDTLFCDSGMLSYVSPLPVTYSWSTGSDSTSAVVKQGGLVKLSVDHLGCTITDSSFCTVPQTPPIYLPADTSYCGPGMLKYVSSLPVTYAWNTGSVSDTTGVGVSGLYWLQLDNQGCISRDSTQATVNAVPVVNLGDDTAVCLNLQPYLLTAGNTPGNTYLWQDKSSGSTYLVVTPGLYYVTETGVDGCSAADSVRINLRPPPYFSLGKAQPICPGEAIYLNPGVDTLTYTWQSGSSDTILRVTEPGTYFVTGANDCGTYQDSVTIYEGICVVHIPSAFTPNGDGTNDLFKVLGVEVVDHFDFCIYNRWGQKVFETEDKGQGWDGTTQGIPQPVGAYVYTLRFRYTITGQSYQVDGTVMLIK